NAFFSAPAAFVLEATAFDPDGTVSRVDFFSGGAFLGSAAAAPYSFPLSNLAAGSYTFTAQAVDNSGATSASTAVNVTVAPPNSPPTVNLISPTNNALFSAPAAFVLEATASDMDGTISRVD